MGKNLNIENRNKTIQNDINTDYMTVECRSFFLKQICGSCSRNIRDKLSFTYKTTRMLVYYVSISDVIIIYLHC